MGTILNGELDRAIVERAVTLEAEILAKGVQHYLDVKTATPDQIRRVVQALLLANAQARPKGRGTVLPVAR